MDTGSHGALCDAETHGQCASPGVNFNFNPSLASRAAISITAALWYHEDVLNPNNIYCLSSDDTKHEDRVAENARSLLIPPNPKENILASIRPVKKQLQHWIRTYGKDILYDVYLYSDFCWTSLGLIDFTKTSSNIIRRGGLTPIKAFELACISCSAEYIYKLWPLVRNDFNKNKSFYQREIAFWVWRLRNTFPTPDTYHKLQSEFFQEGFTSAFYDGNLSALKFFFEQQHLEDRKSFIKMTEDVVKLVYSDVKPRVLLLLLSYMDGSQQDKFLRNDPVNNLICFLKWPLQHFFLQVADKLWECCTEDDFCEVIRVLTEKIILRQNEAVIYRNLFIGFWMRSPLKLRNHYIKNVFGEVFKDIFYPLSIDNGLKILCSGAYDETVLYTTFLYDAYASLYFILEDDKFRAIEALFKKFPSSIERQRLLRSFLI